MKEKLINNLGLKILSCFLAFFMWLIVVNVSNPVGDRKQGGPAGDCERAGADQSRKNL